MLSINRLAMIKANLQNAIKLSPLIDGTFAEGELKELFDLAFMATRMNEAMSMRVAMKAKAREAHESSPTQEQLNRYRTPLKGAKP